MSVSSHTHGLEWSHNFCEHAFTIPWFLSCLICKMEIWIPVLSLVVGLNEWMCMWYSFWHKGPPPSLSSSCADICFYLLLFLPGTTTVSPPTNLVNSACPVSFSFCLTLKPSHTATSPHACRTDAFSVSQHCADPSLLACFPLRSDCVIAWEFLDGKGFALFIALSLAPGTLQALTGCVMGEKQSGSSVEEPLEWPQIGVSSISPTVLFVRICTHI